MDESRQNESRQILVADLGRKRKWSPLQARVLMCQALVINLVGGRRLGKTFVASIKFLARVLRRLFAAAAEVRRGERPPWPGLGKRKAVARLFDPDVEAWVTAPRQLHLDNCRAKVLMHFSGQASRLIHHEIGIVDAGRQLWLQSGGATARIRFVVAGSVQGVVSGGIHELWIEESGLTENQVIGVLEPATWEHGGSRIHSGTPALGPEHWYTQSILAGMDPSHPFYEPDISKRDPDVETFVGSSRTDAFLAQVREQAVSAARHAGGVWAAQWVDGDWRIKNAYIYEEWDKNVHVADYDPKAHILNGVALGYPKLTLGIIDWAYSSERPGACIVLRVWFRNPLQKDDRTRPLVVVAADRQEVLPYTRDGWYGVFEELHDEFGIDYWIADPSRHELLRTAAKFKKWIGKVKPAPKADKDGRIVIVQSWLHHEVGVSPALFVAREAKVLQRQFPAYKRKRNKDGTLADKPSDHDDHCLDCVAFGAGHLTVKGVVSPPRPPYG